MTNLNPKPHVVAKHRQKSPAVPDHLAHKDLAARHLLTGRTTTVRVPKKKEKRFVGETMD